MTALLAQSSDNLIGWVLGLGVFGIVVALLIGVFWLWMLIDALTNRTLDSTNRIIWLLVIFFFPLVGGLVYIFAGRKGKLAV